MGTARAQPGHRMEHDLLGELAVAGDAYYGVHTTRALRNFAVSGIPIGHHPELVSALAAVKQAREARASSRPVRELAQERGLLPPEVIDTLLADPGRLTGTASPQNATATRLPAGPPTTITGGAT
jgi:aspartate ammonia-lyase